MRICWSFPVASVSCNGEEDSRKKEKESARRDSNREDIGGRLGSRIKLAPHVGGVGARSLSARLARQSASY